jgi:hypothetical protein
MGGVNWLSGRILNMTDGDYLFQLPDMHNLYCRFHGEGNEISLVKVFDDKWVHRYSITFLSPNYIKCPLEWKGAGFRRATLEEQKAFFTSVPTEIKETWTSHGLDVEAHFYDYDSLYIVDIDLDSDSPSQVQFLAGESELHEKG